MIYFYLDESGKQTQRQKVNRNFLNPKWVYTFTQTRANARYFDFKI